jgi:putative acetyltransferase
VRREKSSDTAAVRSVQVAAFRRRGTSEEPAEAALVDQLRQCAGWLPKLSLVAEIDGEIVGHVVTTRGFVDGHPALGLGPIGVDPSVQQQGVGLALMRATIGAAEALDEPLIALLGSPSYYGRFGFVASSDFGIAAPEPAWGDNFQVLPLSCFTTAIHGTFVYAPPFNDI